jgi:predicted membrane GTPase involved in stress response
VPDSGLKKKILAAVHDSPLVGHQGFFRTYRQIRERFLWKGLEQDVMRYISERIWSFTMPDMINPQKGIDLMTQ